MENESSNKSAEENKQSPDTLDSIENKIGKVDRILDKTKAVFKKHWGIILFILFCAFMYWAWNLPPVESEATPQDEQQLVSDTPYYDEEYIDTTYQDAPKE
jgi:hypothetical protein